MCPINKEKINIMKKLSEYTKDKNLNQIMDKIVEKEMDKTFNEGIDFDPETKTVAYNSSHENYVDISIDNNPTIDGEIVPGVQVWSIFKRKKGETREDGNPLAYALKGEGWTFRSEEDREAIEKQGVKIYFANTKHLEGNKYSSVSNSRLFGLTTSAKSLQEAKGKVYNAIKGNIDEKLDYRTDIGNI